MIKRFLGMALATTMAIGFAVTGAQAANLGTKDITDGSALAISPTVGDTVTITDTNDMCLGGILPTYIMKPSYVSGSSTVCSTPRTYTFTAASVSSGSISSDYPSTLFTWSSVSAATNTDATVTSGFGTEATSLSTTVDTVGEATSLLDFTITDGGTSDGLATTVSQIVVHVGGTASTTELGNMAWLLNGPDTSNVSGIYNSGAGTVTFSGLSISVANGGNETYTVSSYFTLTPGLSDGHTITLSTDGDTDFTVGASGTQMATTSAVTNGSGAAISVVATKLGFTTQPAGSVSGAALTTQPVVAAQDFAGNTDIDFTGTVTLTSTGAGAISGTGAIAATSGVATFSGISYIAVLDQESFTLTASSAGLTSVTSNSVTSDVVATHLAFSTQPAPTSLTSGALTSFTTVPVVVARDANDTVDTGYTTSIVLSVTDPNDGTLDGTVNSLAGAGDSDGSAITVTLTPSSGVATFSGLAIQYTNGVSSTEYLALRASSGALTALNSTPLTTTDAAPTVTSVSVPAAGNYVAGQNLDFVVNTSEAVTVNTTGGTPQIALTIGATTVQANYLSGSGTSALAFRYTIAAGDADSDGIAVGSLALNGGTLQDSVGNAMTLTLNSVAATSGVLVDTVAPTVAITGPTGIISADFTVTFTFSEAVTGFDVGDVTVVNGTAGAFSGSGTTYTLVIAPQVGTTVSVSVAAGSANDTAGNGNSASNVFTLQAASPASAFDTYRDEIKQVLTDEATRGLRSSVASNQRMTRDARDRFIAGQKASSATVSMSNSVPFDITGGFDLGAGRLSSSGSFFGQTGDFEGTSRRLVFGDFDLQKDSATGSTTATLNGKIAWERKTSDKTMLGYFIGGELAHSSLDGSFVGDQDRVGVSVGGYAVHQLGANIYADGFVSFGAGRNNLNMANDVLALTSDYTTRTATLGGALSGVYTFATYEFRPELAFTYGKTWIGTVGFTGRAYGLVDDTLSLDAGNVTLATLTLRPEVIWALDGQSVSASASQLSFAPRLVCERVVAGASTSDCGGGGEFGLTSHSEDGLSNAEIRVIMDRVGGSTSSSVAVNLEHRF